MKIAVLGAHGKTAQYFIPLAVEQGHTVVAGVRKLRPTDSNSGAVTYVQCDTTNTQQVQSIAASADCIVSLLGHSWKPGPLIQTLAMQTICSLPNAHGIRIVSLTGSGVRIAGDSIPLIDRIVTPVLRLIAKDRINDGQTHFDVLRSSNTRWTVLRVFKLTNGPLSRYRLSLHGPVQLMTSRRTVSAALLQIIETDDYIHQAPLISS